MFKLPDEFAGLALRVEMSLVPVRAEFLVTGPGLRVVDQAPDEKDRARDSDQGLGMASPLDQTSVAGAEEGVGPGGGVRLLVEGSLEPGVALAGQAGGALGSRPDSARAQFRPGGEVVRGGEYAHVGAEFGQDGAG
ncbi:hypothetical protein M878_00930 [Streptomyces roseochromogenus subsp. oscitans DS 12.976]|uniref:Uncharacterized protein n=1 Tax=Streptomyces roseochromogenus subsp. oscitans DS 12.976 TaxID=1352936 RepID=V6KZ29_STRRC|nr:hypothetical protein M878_00930 [Streptomyces roseochromogenus subsp. oscitans DS 12.976]